MLGKTSEHVVILTNRTQSKYPLLFHSQLPLQFGEFARASGRERRIIFSVIFLGRDKYLYGADRLGLAPNDATNACSKQSVNVKHPNGCDLDYIF